jgi:hypothetical protein
MRYMMMIKATKNSEAGIPPSPDLMAAMGALAEEMAKAGILLASDGLQPSSQGMRISCVAGKRTVIDGPFAETKELIAGYAVLKANSKEEALALANRCVDVHLDAGIEDFHMEIRPLSEPFDPGSAPR